MATTTDEILPIPDGYGAVTPWVISRNTAGLIDFVTQAFDAIELVRVDNEDGAIGHAEVRIGDSVVMMFDAPPEWSDTPAFLRLYVKDGDAAYQQALDAGATPITVMTELFWGDRVGRVCDPFGNLWWIQHRLTELEPDEMGRRAAQPEFIEAMRYVQSSLTSFLRPHAS
jgi:PhnB protein